MVVLFVEEKKDLNKKNFNYRKIMNVMDVFYNLLGILRTVIYIRVVIL